MLCRGSVLHPTFIRMAKTHGPFFLVRVSTKPMRVVAHVQLLRVTWLLLKQAKFMVSSIQILSP